MDIKDFYREVDGIYANEDWEAAEELFNTAMEQTCLLYTSHEQGRWRSRPRDRSVHR